MHRCLCAAVLAAALWGCGGDGPSGDLDSGPGEVAISCQGPADCASLVAGPCQVASCVSGGCTLAATHEGETCDPDDRCASSAKVCKGGECTYTTLRECVARACKEATGCNPLTGACLYAPGPDGGACDADHNPCTDDRCGGGECVAAPNTCQCQTDQNCPTNPDKCVAPLWCEGSTHTCVPGVAKQCVSGGECKPGTCLPATGECDDKPLPDGTPCGQDLKCVAGATCAAGGCVGTDKCDDHNPCTKDLCEAATGACSHPAAGDGVSCDDGDACTEGDACGAGACAGTPKDCDDHNDCTQDQCDQAAGCLQMTLPGNACDDHDACTSGDACTDQGKCVGALKNCDDGNPCTKDTCDPATAACGHEGLDATCDDGDACTAGDACVAGTCKGTAIFGCCKQDADCDDRDPCTVESCVDHACQREGEAVPVCLATNGCNAGWCRAGDGGCETFDLSMPRVLVDWDLAAGMLPAGFVWAGGGTLGAQGVAGGAFRLPLQVAPAGVKVLVLRPPGLDPCDGLDVTVAGAMVVKGDCRADGGDAVRAFAWTSAADGLLDAVVTVGAGATVSRVTLFAWAGGGCRPLGPVLVAGGSGFSDLAVGGGGTGAFAAYRTGDSMHAMLDDLFGTAASSGPLGDTSTISATKFSTGVAVLGAYGFGLAFGGADKRVQLVTVDAAGHKGASAALSAFTPTDDQYQPVLLPHAGAWARIVWTSSTVDGEGLGIATAVVKGPAGFDGTVAGTPVVVNPASAGDQHSPAAWLGDGGGAVAWISGQAPPQTVFVRALDAAGEPTGNAAAVFSSDTVALSHLAVTRVAESTFVAWQTDAGKVAGKVLNGDLVESAVLDFGTDPAIGRVSPSLLPAAGGALMVYVRIGATETSVVQSSIGMNGAVGGPVGVSGGVNDATASPVASGCGPFMSCVAFNDTKSTNKGIYLGLTSPACPLGPRDCTDPANPRVCVGFGADGYVTVAGAVGWCP